MAVKIICNYSKRLGLPGYSSHQFSVSVEKELSTNADIQLEAARFYQTLQNAVDQQIQNTGFVPKENYGVIEKTVSPTRALEAPKLTPHPKSNDDTLSREESTQWKASLKQRDLIFKLVENNGLEMEDVQSLAEEMFTTSNLPELNKIQISGLIDELLSRYGKKSRRETHSLGSFNLRAKR